MNFFINANGNIIAVNPSTVNQGTAEVSVIRLFAPIPISSVVTCSYKLPNGVWGVPVKMTAVTTLEDVLSKTNTMTDGMDSFSSFSVWEWSIEDTMTQFFGTVEVQFFCHFGGVGNDYPRLASDIASFSVRKGVPTYIPPINAEDLEFEKLLNAILSALQELQQADAQGAFLSQQYANQALEHAENALVSERNAEDSADSAATSAGEAADSAGEAKTAADNAETAKEDAERAKSDAEKAKGDAETAKNAAVAAREAAEIFSATAQTHANNASTDATAAADSATTAQEAAKEAKIYAIRAEEVLENVGNFIPGELGEDGKFYPFDKDTGQVSTTALAAPSAGVVYFDLFSNKLYTWDSATGSYIIQADLNATGGGGSLDPSVLAEYVKFTDWATNEKGGVLRGVSAFGFTVDLYGRGQIVAATDSEIEAKTNEFKPIVPKSINKAIKVGITANDEDWTDEEKTAACETVGAVKRDTKSSNGVYGKSGGVDILYNVSQWGHGGGEDAIARRTNKGGLRVVLDDTNDKPGEMATPRSYVDELQKFTHYITIRSTDETASPANVNLQITNYDDFSLTVSESIYDFSQLASAIGTMLEASEENPGSVSASGSIIYNGSLHLVLSATTKDGTALILKTFDTSAQELAEITMEEPYFLIDEIIKKEI